MKVLKVTKSGCLSHVGRRTASLRTSCAVPGSVGGAEKADCVALRRPAACGVSKNRRERSQADADSWNGLFDSQDGPQRAYRAASITAPATPFCFCTTQKHLTVKTSIISIA